MLSCGKLILFVLGFTFFCFDGVAEMQTNTVVRRERLKPFMDGEWGYISENSGATLSRYDGQGGTVAIPSKLGGLPVKKNQRRPEF